MFQTESFAADDCHTTADGKIIVQNSTGSGTLPSDDKPLSIDGGTSFVADFCMESPLFYKMEGYKIFLCVILREPLMLIFLDTRHLLKQYV